MEWEDMRGRPGSDHIGPCKVTSGVWILLELIGRCDEVGKQ